MITSLDLTCKLKLDEATKYNLEALRYGGYGQHIKPPIDAALRRFKGDHLVRAVEIENPQALFGPSAVCVTSCNPS